MDLAWRAARGGKDAAKSLGRPGASRVRNAPPRETDIDWLSFEQTKVKTWGSGRQHPAVQLQCMQVNGWVHISPPLFALQD